MCTLVILRRPGHAWPLIVAANRDEMADRPWRGPGRHWPDRNHITAGIDELAGGTWLGINDDRLVAAILNRVGSLGPQDDKRSRGELPLEALDHAEAHIAAEALATLNGSAYRSFNLIVADAADAYWIAGDGENSAVRVSEIPEGVSLITSSDLNDLSAERIGRYLPKFKAVTEPDPDTGNWDAWIELLADYKTWEAGADRASMSFSTDFGFETVSSSLIAMPAMGDADREPQWLFCPERPAPGRYTAVV